MSDPRPSFRSPYGRWKCNRCGKIFETRRQLFDHGKSVHDISGHVWNYGKTKNDDPLVRQCSETLKSKYASKKVHVWCEGKSLSAETKKKISESMRLAHANGTAHNIGESRWNNHPSYPETFWARAIENNFSDKNYVREMSFDKFSLDFAWPHLKKCIEIDGDQHVRFHDYRMRDRRKELALLSRGWELMRIPWNECCRNPILWIQKAKRFIDGTSFVPSMFT